MNSSVAGSAALETTTEPEVLLRVDTGHVRTLTLNRPERRNAIDDVLAARLAEEITQAEADRDVWVVVVTGAGSAFCSGGDLKAMASADETEAQRQVRPKVTAHRTFMEMMTRMETPVVAALNGSAVAGGFELALACDLRICADSALLGLPEAKRGMGAAFGTVMLPRLIPMATALELLFTGRYMDAREALGLGLVNQVVAQAQVLPVAQQLAATIAANAPLSVRRMKANAYGTSGVPIAAALATDLGPDPYASHDRIEGARAFVEKREPRWSNK